MSRAHLRLVSTRKRKSYRELKKLADAEVIFWEIKERLRKTKRSPELRACKMRAVIGEKFNHARVDEAIVTFQFGAPHIIPLADLSGITRTYCHDISYTTREIFSKIKTRSAHYMEGRKKVRNRKWK